MTRVVLLAGVALLAGAVATADAQSERRHPQTHQGRNQPDQAAPPPSAPTPPPSSGGERVAVPRGSGDDSGARRAPRVREPGEAGESGRRAPVTAERGGGNADEQRRTGAGERRRVPSTGTTTDSGQGDARRRPPSTGTTTGSGQGEARRRAPSGGTTTDPDQGQARRRVPDYSRPRNGDTATGSAVRRPYGQPPVVNGRYRGYYGNDYYWTRPYSHWGWAPWGAGFFWYDPWWAAGPGYYGSGPYYPGYGSRYADGSVKLKMRPREAQVFVDGYYVGIVDEFDGIFQKLELEEGPHRIEVRLDGYEPQSFDVRITFDHTITLRGELTRVP